MYGHETHRKLEIEMIGESRNPVSHDAKGGSGDHSKQGATRMLDQYKSTFVGMQVVIFLVTVGMFLLLQHDWALCLKFFVTMQVASVMGAVWGQRLKARTRASALKGGR
jgi:hypothetical protein